MTANRHFITFSHSISKSSLRVINTIYHLEAFKSFITQIIICLLYFFCERQPIWPYLFSYKGEVKRNRHFLTLFWPLIKTNLLLLFPGQKPHECHHCGKRFALGCNMKAHIKTHETSNGSATTGSTPDSHMGVAMETPV